MCTGIHPFIPLPNGAQVVLRYGYLGQQVENVLWAVFPTPPAEGNLSDLANAVADSWQSSLRLTQVTGLTINSVVATGWSTDADPQVYITEFTNTTGNIAEAGLASVDALKIQYKPGYRAHVNAAGPYHVGIPKSDITGNTFDSAYLASVRVAWDTMRTAIHEAGWEQVIFKQCMDNTWLVNGEPVPISAVSVKSTIATQRRRGPGRGS